MARENKMNCFQRNNNKIIADFLLNAVEAKIKSCQHRILHTMKLSFKHEFSKQKKSRKEGKLEHQEGKNTVNKIVSTCYSLSYPLELSNFYLMVQQERTTALPGVILNSHRGTAEDNYKLERVKGLRRFLYFTQTD